MNYYNGAPPRKDVSFAILGFFWVVLWGVSCTNPQRNSVESTDLSKVDTLLQGDAKAKITLEDSSNAHFTFQREKPVDGKLMGVVEVGASGFNAFVVNMDKQKRWEVVSRDFGQSLVYEGLATTEDIRKGMQDFVTFMAGEGVNREYMHFLISSGAQKEPKTKSISAELKKLGFNVKLVTAREEGLWALNCLLPDSFSSKAFVTDLGSGNTKIAWRNENKIEVVEAPGSKYFEKDIQDEEVYKTVKVLASGIPANKTKYCFIMGGTPFDLAKQHRQGNERYTVMKNPEEYKATKPKTKSGINIYKAIKDATGCQTFVFDWDGNFAIGYLLEMAN